jgi:hypothetical protein
MHWNMSPSRNAQARHCPPIRRAATFHLGIFHARKPGDAATEHRRTGPDAGAFSELRSRSLHRRGFPSASSSAGQPLHRADPILKRATIRLHEHALCSARCNRNTLAFLKASAHPAWSERHRVRRPRRQSDHARQNSVSAELRRAGAVIAIENTRLRPKSRCG